VKTLAYQLFCTGQGEKPACVSILSNLVDQDLSELKSGKLV